MRGSARRVAIGLSILIGTSLAGATACRDRNRSGNLTPPSDAAQWEAKYAPAFDDGYTKESIRLSGRAPNDVLDQRLFAARLGHANVVALVDVLQVWGRGKYQGRQDQYLEVEIEEIVMGELMKGTEDRQRLVVRSEDELPGKLQGKRMILFLRWAPDEEPPYHHHLMPAEDEAVAYINAMVEHAQAEGVLDASGSKTKRGGRRKKRSKDKAVDSDDLP